MLVDELKKSILDKAFYGELVANNSKLENYCSDEYIIKEKKRLKKEENVIFKKCENTDNWLLYSLPENWKWVKLGNIVFNWGQTSPKSEFSYIDISSIDNENHILSLEEKIISPDKAPSRARKIVKENDIIYSTVRPYLHNMCIINKTFTKTPIASTGFAVMHCIDLVFNKYLFYYLMCPYFDNYVNSSKNSIGIAYPAINDEKLFNADVPVPPIEEQHQIVDKIEELFNKLDEIKPIEEELNKLKKNFPISFKYAILNDAIKGKLIKNNPKLLNKIKNCIENPPFKVFDNWSWVKIGDVLDIQTGLSYKKADQCVFEDSDVRVLRGGNININFQYELKEDDIYVRNVKKYEKLTKGDILTPAVTSMEQMGKVAYIDKTLDKITAGGFVYIIRSKNSEILNPKYVLYFISSKFHKEMCKPNIHKSGQAFYNLNKSGLIEQPIPIPPIEEQQRIVDKLEQLLPLCDDIEKIIGES